MKLNDTHLTDALCLCLNAKGALEFIRDSGEVVEVAPVRCFPWSRQAEYISLRDKENREISLIKKLDLLSKTSRAAVITVLAELDFVFQVTRVLAIDTEFEIRNWKVETRQGGCQFQTKMDEWPWMLNSNEMLVQDICSNLFKISNIKQLDKTSQELLWPYID